MDFFKKTLDPVIALAAIAVLDIFLFVSLGAWTVGGGEIRTFHDHRIAMAFAIASLRATDEITVLDCDHVATSFPGFDALAADLGLNIQAAD